MTTKNAPKVAYCFDCNEWFNIPKDSDDIQPCPRCGAVSRQVKCTRCEYTWMVHRPRYPKTCSNCKTPYWNYEPTQTRKPEDRAKKYEPDDKYAKGKSK